jgi:hypothetical protein
MSKHLMLVIATFYVLGGVVAYGPMAREFERQGTGGYAGMALMALPVWPLYVSYAVWKS